MKSKVKEQTASDFVNVKDIKDVFLYTKDDFVMGYIRVHFINIDLLSENERRNKAKRLAGSFEKDRRNFTYCSFPREIDLDNYKSNLKELHRQELNDVGRKKLLEELIVGATELSTSGENYEHQHFIKLWSKIEGNKQHAENEIMERQQEFVARYQEVGIATEILRETEIIKLCNLFGNSEQASFEVFDYNTLFDQVLKLKQ
ncbi:MAG: hypothetical protein RSD28_09725 [Lachnospiraceae bacterium]